MGDAVLLAIRLFLAAVLLSAAATKLRLGVGSLAVARYEIWAPSPSRRIDSILPLVEVAAAAALLLLTGYGLLVGAGLFLAFAEVQSLGLVSGYAGACGCGTGRSPVSRFGAFRAYFWATVAFALAPVEGVAVLLVALTAAAVTLAIVLLSLASPGPRLRGLSIQAALGRR